MKTTNHCLLFSSYGTTTVSQQHYPKLTNILYYRKDLLVRRPFYYRTLHFYLIQHSRGLTIELDDKVVSVGD